jgi:hypothetical protein
MAVQDCRGDPRVECEGGGRPPNERSGVDTQEKPVGEDAPRPYRKPTQVGEASSLR